MAKDIMNMLGLRSIRKSFGDVRVPSGVSLCLEREFVYTLMGGNGSEKTTAITFTSKGVVK